MAGFTSFKTFSSFIDREDDPTDEQITEIFGLFKNNEKLERLKRERERLKGLSAAKKAELDKALKAFGASAKPGGIKDDDLAQALSAMDRKELAKQDRAGAKNQTGRLAYEEVDRDGQAVLQALCDLHLKDLVSELHGDPYDIVNELLAMASPTQRKVLRDSDRADIVDWVANEVNNRGLS